MAVILCTAVAVSLDGFFSGFVFGVKRIRISLLSLMFISLCSVAVCFPSVYFGFHLSGILSAKAGKIIGALLFLLLAALTFTEARRNKDTENKNANIFKLLTKPELTDKDKDKNLDILESLLLGIALSVDASVASLTLALTGHGYIVVPFIFGLCQFILIGIGNIIGKTSKIRCADNFSAYFSAVFFIILAALKLI